MLNIKPMALLAGFLCLPLACLAADWDEGAIDPRQNGPSSRTTGLIISEIMYHPKARADGLNLEFVELLNTEPVRVDISGFRLSGDIGYTFPSGTTLAATSRVVVAANPAAMQSVYGITGVLGPWTNSLPNSGGIVRLRDRINARLLEVEYNDAAPWPAAADGAGASLVCTKPDYGENDARAWSASSRVNGSPGSAHPVWTNTLANVVINEWMSHTDPPEVDSIELYNPGPAAVNIGGCWLSDDPATNKYRIPNGTTIPADGYVSFGEPALGFGLTMAGGKIVLLNTNLTRVIDAVAFGAQANGSSSGRFPDGAPDFRVLTSRTFGTANSRPVTPSVVINEIMYNPISGLDDDEFVELYNRSAGTVEIGYWRFTAGIDYRFPAGTTMPAGSYVVVAKNRTRLLSRYPTLNPAIVFGDYDGKLSDRGERIELAKPDDDDLPGQDFVEVDAVTYNDGWGEWTDGGGSSIELIDAHSDNDCRMNWAGSDETQKAAWTIVSTNEPVDCGSTGKQGSYIPPDQNPVDQVHIFYTEAAGECVVDDVEVRSPTNAVIYISDNFNVITKVWTNWGNHVRSKYLPGEGYGGSGGYLVRADGGGLVGMETIPSNAPGGKRHANRVGAFLSTAPLKNNSRVQISAKARWRAGWPYVTVSLRGFWAEALIALNVPTNLGTPGAVNSRRLANAPPAIWDVSHFPVLPASNESVRVQCRVDDPDGVGVVTLRYRMDPVTTYTATNMLDNGVAPDIVAGDGIYTANLPGHKTGTNVAFVIHASDVSAPTSSNRFPATVRDLAPATECVVRFGHAPLLNAIPTYSIWMTATNLACWYTLTKHSNEPLDLTFVYGNYRAIYEAAGRYRGNGRDYDPTPFINLSGQPATRISYSLSLELPNSERFLGDTDLAIDCLARRSATTIIDTTLQSDYFSYWAAALTDIPVVGRKYVRVYFNSANHGLRQDIEAAGRGFAQRTFDDPDPVCWKHTGAIEGDHFGQYIDADGEFKRSKYRWFVEQAGTGIPTDDASSIYRHVAAFAQTNDAVFAARVGAIIDVRSWASYFGANGIMLSGDSYGRNFSHNMYSYMPRNNRSRLFLDDMDSSFADTARPFVSFFPTSTVDQVTSPWTTVPTNLFSRPIFRRAYWAYVKDYADRAMDPAVITPFMNDWYTAFTNNGLTGATTPQPILAWIAERRADVYAQLAAVAAPFAITTSGGANFATNVNPVVLEGTAPIEAEILRVNGTAYPVIYTTLSNWQVRVALRTGANNLTVDGVSRLGAAVPGASDTITVTYTGGETLPDGWVVINEIMYHPTDPYGSYVELYNRHPTATFDLGGMRLEGADVTFAAGTLLGPGQYGVVVENLQGYAAAYTNAEAVLATYNGSLDNGGEWLRLWRPVGESSEALVDEVYFDDDPPWPATADGAGPSLQLIDAGEDNNRIGNWGVDAVQKYTPGAANSVAADLPALPQVWINEVMPTNTTFVRDNANEFEPWLELYNAGGAPIDLGAGYRLTIDPTNLTGWAFSGSHVVAAGGFQTVWADAETGETTASALHAGVRLTSPTGSVSLVWMNAGTPIVLDYVRWSAVPANNSYGRDPDGARYAAQLFLHPTPGTANDAGSGTSLLRLNEWMADNTRTVSDPADAVQPSYEDWFEIVNPGATAANLTGYTLTDTLSNPTKYKVPLGYAVAAGGHLRVWADEETAQNAVANGDLHVNFKLSTSGEALGLYAPDGTAVDTITFGAQTSDLSEGRWPDGNARILQMAIPTPGASNVLFGVQGFAHTGGVVRLQWNTRVNWPYQLWTTTNLIDGPWLPTGAVMTAAGGMLSTNLPATTDPARFYQVKQQ